ncbi:hypothetical protein VUR80DRAFT_169 [Thermomyces stellatus]
MRTTTHPLPPSSSLPPLGTLAGLSEGEILGLIRNLSALYCPLPLCPSLFPPGPKADSASRGAESQQVAAADSGYASETDGVLANEGPDSHEARRIAGLRADPFERAFADRWLAGFIARAPTLHCLSEDVSERVVDQAAYVLEAILAGSGDEGPQVTDGGSDSDFTHELSFDLLSDAGTSSTPVRVRLRDRVAGANGGDHDDVGLQLWGASILLSEMMCSSPARFGLDRDALGPSPRIIELGAGTGLVSLVLGSALPQLGVTDSKIIATDYHPAVLENLRANIALGDNPVETSRLDWSSSSALQPPLDVPARLLVATDVVYGPEHAFLLRDCAARLLAPDGIFWMLNAIRKTGRFEDVVDTP